MPRSSGRARGMAMQGREELPFRFSTPLEGYDFELYVAGGSLLEARFIASGHRSAARGEAANSTESNLRDKVCRFLDGGAPVPQVKAAAPRTKFIARFREALDRLAPPGRVVSYGDIARHIASSARAVGGACRSNPLALFVPCHRIICSDGGPGGYFNRRDGKPDLHLKRHLLLLEGADVGDWQY